MTSSTQACRRGMSSRSSAKAATVAMILLERCAKAVAESGTRAIAPPSSRSWTTRIEASEAASRSSDQGRLLEADVLHEDRPTDGDRVIVGVLGRIHRRVGLAWTMSASGVASARNGAIARSPASASPA